MTVMNEGLLLNLKYIKMRREEGGFQAFQALLTQLPLLAVNHLRFCDGLKCQCSMSCQAKSVIK